MDKLYMMLKVRERMATLHLKYKAACHCKAVNGKELTAGAAAAVRTQCKRDMCILALIQQLLETSQAVYIEDEDAIEGFDKLVEPIERSKA